MCFLSLEGRSFALQKGHFLTLGEYDLSPSEPIDQIRESSLSFPFWLIVVSVGREGAPRLINPWPFTVFQRGGVWGSRSSSSCPCYETEAGCSKPEDGAQLCLGWWKAVLFS